MSSWLIWGDYVHTRPGEIGTLRFESEDDRWVREARDRGFDADARTRNGFEPWGARYSGEDAAGVEFEIASFPTVRGWVRLD